MIEFLRAGETDDAELRRLLRNNSMASWVDISLEREPSYFAGMNPLTRDVAVIARENGNAFGMYAGSLHTLFVHGRPAQQGYLGGLRIDPGYRKSLKVIRAGFASIREHLPVGDNGFWYTSIASQNEPARRLLEAGLKGLPRYVEAGRMQSLVIRRAGGGSSLWRRASPDLIDDLVAFHNREAAGFELAPVLSRAWVERIGVDNFLVCGGDEIQACLAIWDQSAYKQVVVRGYHPLVRFVRPFYNACASMSGRVALPRLNARLDQSFIAFAAFSTVARSRAVQLLREALSFCRSSTAVIGVNVDNPLLHALLTLKPVQYTTHIYSVSWHAEPPAWSSMVQPEIAIL